MAKKSPLDGRMIFLVGARRSGTNWLQRMLACHPSIVTIPSETHLFSHGLAPLMERFQHGLPGSTATSMIYVDPERLTVALRSFCDTVFSDLAATLDPEAAMVLERTPLHAVHLDLIGSIYPDAHVIHIVRDGWEVSRSLLAQPWGPDTMTAAAEEWRSTVEAAQHAVVPLYREVRYESLVADPVAGATELLEWLGLKVPAKVRADIGVESLRQYLVTESKPEPSPKDRTDFEHVAGSIQRSLGYAPRTGSPAPAEPPARGRRSLPLYHSARRALRPAIDMENVARLIDRFVALLDTEAYERVAALMAPNPVVAIVEGTDRVSARGDAASRLLVDHLRTTADLRRHRLRVDGHYGPTTCTVVTTSTSPTHQRACRSPGCTRTCRARGPRCGP